MTEQRDWIGEMEGEPAFELELLTRQIGECIVDRLDKLRLTRRELAARMGVSPARVTQILRGGENLTLRSLVALATALDARIEFQMEDLPRRGASASMRKPHARAS